MDDGYLLQNVGHHLVTAKHFRELRKLLTNAAWLESKLHSYGVASVVADYRRCLTLSSTICGSMSSSNSLVQYRVATLSHVSPAAYPYLCLMSALGRHLAVHKLASDHSGHSDRVELTARLIKD